MNSNQRIPSFNNTSTMGSNIETPLVTCVVVNPNLLMQVLGATILIPNYEQNVATAV